MNDLAELIAGLSHLLDLDLPDPVVDFESETHWAPLGRAADWPSEVVDALGLEGETPQGETSGPITLLCPLENPFPSVPEG